MILQGARRRSRLRAHAGGSGHLRYAAAYAGTRARLRTSPTFGAPAEELNWRRRIMDDRDLLGLKLLLLAALLGLTALLERTV